MKNSLPLVIVAGLSLLLIWLIWFWQPGQQSGDGDAHRQLALSAKPGGGDFTLRSWRGPLRLSELRGRVVLIYFGYTWCPDICPTNLAIISLALKQLTPAEREQVQVLFVSVDPERDTVERLKEFAAYFAPDILGVTGKEDEIATAARLYGAAYRRSTQSGSAMGYTVDHSSYTYVVDRDGKLAETLDHATPAERIVEVIRSHLGQG